MALNTTSLFWTIHSPTTGEPNNGAVMRLPLAGGTPATLASNQSFYAIAANDTSASWISYPLLADPGPANVMTVPVGGGTPTTLVSDPNPNGTIAMDSASVYWIDCPTPNKPPGCALMKVPLAGGAASTLASLTYGSNGTSESLAVDRTSPSFSTDGALVRLPVGGGALTTLVSAEPIAIAVDATSVYWVDVGCSGSACGTIKKLTPK
jgi:hypothetical protein